MKKVVITGPESTGKSTLSSRLSQHYQAPMVDEYARQYLKARRGKYAEADLLEIAKGQVRSADKASAKNPELLICDTGLEVIRIWSEYKYGKCDPAILKMAKERQPHLYILLKPDIPWHPDPLRENPNNREELYSIYRKTLADYHVPVVEIGDYSEERFHRSILAINRLLDNSL